MNLIQINGKPVDLKTFLFCLTLLGGGFFVGAENPELNASSLVDVCGAPE